MSVMSATPPPLGPPLAPDPRDRPGVLGYWLGGFALALGMLVCSVLLVIGFTKAAESLQFPVEVDRDGAVMIDEPGGYTIYVIGPSLSPAQFTLQPLLEVTAPDGSLVPTAEYVGTQSRSSGSSRQAVAVATFRAEAPGRYHLSASNLPWWASLGVGEGVEFDFTAMGLGAAASLGVFLIGLILVIVTAVRRRPATVAPATPYGLPGGPRGPVNPYGGVPYPPPGFPGVPPPPLGSMPGGWPPPGPTGVPPPPGAMPGGWPPQPGTAAPDNATGTTDRSATPWGDQPMTEATEPLPDLTPRDEDFGPPDTAPTS